MRWKEIRRGSETVLSLYIDANCADHVNCTETAWCKWLRLQLGVGSSTYAIDNEAGIPTRGMLRTDLSVGVVSIWCIIIDIRNTLSPKYPVRRRPRDNRVKPTKN